MENFNKVLSFFLGLVVVIVFIIVLSNRLNIKNKIIPLSDITASKKITPTITKQNIIKTNNTEKQEAKIKFTQPTVIKQKTKGGVSNLNTIPETGSATSLVLIYSSSALVGFYLRKFKK